MIYITAASTFWLLPFQIIMNVTTAIFTHRVSKLMVRFTVLVTSVSLEMDWNVQVLSLETQYWCTLRKKYTGISTCCIVYTWINVHNLCLCCISDVNECEIGNNNCNSNASCNNTIGSFRCVCKIGYLGNGITCTVVL